MIQIPAFADATGGDLIEILMWIFVQGTALVVVTAVASRLSRARALPLSHAVWGVLMVALVVVPIVSYMFPIGRAQLAIVPVEWWDAPLTEPADGLQDIRVDGMGARSPMAPSPIESELAAWTDPPVSGSAGFGSVANTLFAIWATGAAAIFMLFLSRQLGLRRLERRARRWSHEAAYDCMRQVRRELGVQRRVRLLEITSLQVPVCWGVWRPTVGLPPAASRWDAARLRAVLVHELAHVRRWDYATYVLGQVACVLYWPNLAVWWAVGRARAESERACDETVLRYGTGRRDYARLLVNSVREAQFGTFGERPVMSMASRLDLGTRVTNVLRFGSGPPESRPWVAVVGFGAALALLGVAAVEIDSDRQLRMHSALAGMDDSAASARAAAVRALGDLREPGSVSSVTRLLGDESASVRLTAAWALAEAGSSLAIYPLLRRLGDSDPRVREAVIMALGRTRDRRAFADLEVLTDSEDSRIRLAATWAIGEIKCEPAIERLTSLLLSSADAPTRLAAARGLRGAPLELVAPILTRALEDPHPEVRAAASESLKLSS
ncbi:MAG: M56 family metallopeptidase [Gemmatimonadota bacterium]